MWNVSDGKYSNAYYGANFVNRIGHGNPELIMVRPSNGQYYETFIYSQYFTMIIDGAVAMDDITLEAIEKISSLPEKVQLTHEALVIAAREAYNRIATKEQQALVTNYSSLVSAENRILALKSQNMTPETPNEPDDNTPDGDPNVKDKSNRGYVVAIVILSITTVVNLLAFCLAVAFIAFILVKRFVGCSSEKIAEPKDAPTSDEAEDIKENTADTEENK
jgi:hypothetical protein